MNIADIVVRQLSLPLVSPYRVSFRTYNALEPIVVEVRDRDGGVGWGEAYIPAGSTAETTDSGWAFCNEHGRKLAGRSVEEAKAMLDAAVTRAPFAACAMLTALAMLERHPALQVAREHRVPLLVPVSGKSREEIADEVERLLDAGYRTLKVKVGWDVDDDLARVRAVQAAARGRAGITMDANRGYDVAQGCRFASSLDPHGIDLFEQPCGAEDWDGNAAVARVSKVPLMLDESIRGLEDIDRAALVPGVKLIKLKLKRAGGLERGLAAMARADALGLGICLGDGVATEILCWVEACASRGYLRRAGDMNGFLKPQSRLFVEPLPFERGEIVVKPGYWPELDRGAVARHELRRERHTRTAVAGAAAT